jgi:hypothetical protein
MGTIRGGVLRSAVWRRVPPDTLRHTMGVAIGSFYCLSSRTIASTFHSALFDWAKVEEGGKLLTGRLDLSHCLVNV